MGRGRRTRAGGVDVPARRPVDDVRVCAGCGRGFAWRPSLAASWDEVRWCSDACRRRGIRPVDRALEAAILALLDEHRDGHAADATTDPSEAARRVDPDGWEALREPARRAARRLVADGTLEMLQHGRVVDPSRAKGPVRLRRARSVR